MTSHHPLQGFNKEEILHYVRSLLHNAETKLEMDDVGGAAWRLADALGALAFCAGPGTQGIDTFTGLGFKIQMVEDANTKQTSES